MVNFYKETDKGIILSIKVIPNSSTTAIAGADEESKSLKIRLCAPPNENQANEELIKFLSKNLKIPKTQVLIVKGNKSRDKKIFLPVSKNYLEEKIKIY